MSTPKRHSPPSGKRRPQQELLYDPNVPTPSHAELARTLVDGAQSGTLCTISVDPEGYPYGSLVTFAVYEGCPIFLVSELAVHTKNLHACDRASLLVAEAGPDNPLALGRVTLVGTCRPIVDANREAIKSVFLEKNPQAEFYVDFGDFTFFRLEIESIRYIGGFGRMSWVDSANWKSAEADPIAPFAAPIIAHMNDDHADVMVLYCQKLSKAIDTTEATMVGVDRYGFEMSAVTADGPRPIRLAFSKPVSNAKEIREEMVALAKQVRQSAEVV